MANVVINISMSNFYHVCHLCHGQAKTPPKNLKKNSKEKMNLKEVR